MRTDIAIHINTGDVPIRMGNKGELFPFSWVSNPSGFSRYIYGELEIPFTLSEKVIANGIACSIPYTPKHKEFYIRVKKSYGGETFSYMHNPVDGSEWFLVQAAGKNAYASELLKYSSNFEYQFVLERGVAKLYANGNSDFEIVNANRQNMNMMLACNPTNNYRYPLSGVGTVNWVNGKTINSKLVDILRKEFNEDGTPVISAEYDFNTRQLNIQLNTTGVE